MDTVADYLYGTIAPARIFQPRVYAMLPETGESNTNKIGLK